MKNAILPFVMLALFSFNLKDAKLTPEERKLAASEMTRTRDLLVVAVSGLSDAQLNFKSSPESWSVAECTEHITISESNIFGMLEAALKTTADPSKRGEVKMTDDKIIVMIADRSNKVKTSEAFVPSGKYGDQATALKSFFEKRANNIRYVMETKDDLRNRYQQLPFGTIDAYQIMLFMSSHTERHVKQIEEVKANADFPKS